MAESKYRILHELGAGGMGTVRKGLLMGQAFPLGMRLAAGKEHLTPWLWAMNGAMSVCASVLAVVIALSWSISAAFWTGCACYVVALISATRIGPVAPEPLETAAAENVRA